MRVYEGPPDNLGYRTLSWAEYGPCLTCKVGWGEQCKNTLGSKNYAEKLKARPHQGRKKMI